MEIFVQVLPKSSHNEIVGLTTDMLGDKWLKVKITAAPEKGKANSALRKFLSKEWGIPASAIQIIKGELSSKKRLRIAEGYKVDL